MTLLERLDRVRIPPGNELDLTTSAELVKKCPGAYTLASYAFKLGYIRGQQAAHDELERENIK